MVRKVERKERVIEANLTIDSVAELIGVHRSTVERLLVTRKLGYYQVGRRRMIGQRHLEQYLALIERKADSDLDPY
jgi:excisionase family DNA binding protein